MLNVRKSRKRLFHWAIALVFLVMVMTGLTLLVPAFSGLAAGGWTRLVHKIAAVLLVGTPLLYAFTNRSAAGRWFRDAAVWHKAQSEERRIVHIWRRWHQLFLSAGFALFVATGSIQWFLKGIVSSSIFNVSVQVHDIVFFASVLILIYHAYFEFVWWMWRRKYCRRCGVPLCAEECPVNAVSAANDGFTERNMLACNGCRLCMKACQREGYYIRSVRTEKSDFSRAA